jgi:hypothetical protein
MLDCVRWMREALDPATRIFSNDVQLAAASGARWDWNEVHHAERLLADGGRPAAAQYWIVHLRQDRAVLPAWEALTAERFERVREFDSGRGARIVVLRQRDR